MEDYKVNIQEIFDTVDSIKQEIIDLRRDFHMHPEVGSEVERTAGIVVDLLRKWGLEVQTGVGITGVVGILRGQNGGSVKTVALRADMDALLIKEENNTCYQSVYNGKMHACGHDGHTAMLLGAAKILAQYKDEIKGNIKFIFQPEEEGPNSGAENMMADGVMNDVDAIFGLHLTTEYPTGTVTIKKGAAMASSDDFEIEMIGIGGHASTPHKCIDAISMAVKVYNDIQFMVSREFDPIDPLIVSIGAFNSGAASNVIQGSAKLKGTIRTLSHEVRAKVKTRICDIVKHVAEEAGGKYKINIIPGVPPLINDIKKATFAEKVVEKVVTKENVLILDKPNMGSEDFAFYVEKVPGVMMMIGARNEEKGFVHLMHHPKFDFDEEALAIGVKLHIQLAMDYLESI